MRHLIVWGTSRSVVAYAIIATVFIACFNAPRAFEERSKYLLGIFYNGNFENYKDGIVYFDYMRRQQPREIDHYLKLAMCYERLGDKARALSFQEKAQALNAAQGGQ